LNPSYKPGDLLEVRVERIVPRGFGIAFAERLTVLIPLSVPGDELTVRIVEIKKRLAFAEIVEIKHPGARRVPAPCPYFGTCGGCNFQQMDYIAQLAAKREIVADCLRRLGKIEIKADIPIVPSPNPWGYRSRARWHLDRDVRAIGYFARNSNDLVDVNSCPVLTPGLYSTLEYLRESMEWDTLWSERHEIEAASGEEGHVSIYSAEGREPAAELSFSVKGETYFFSAETFFQANKFLIGELINAAVEGLTGETALDLYAGVGLFALPLARKFAHVISVEEHSPAVKFAKKNAYHAGLSNIEMISSSVAGYLTDNARTKADLILIDPPRSGTEPGVIGRIAAMRPARIVYVSCEPSILARDLRILLDAGFAIETIKAIDLFPQTHHVETVVRLTLQNS